MIKDEFSDTTEIFEEEGEDQLSPSDNGAVPDEDAPAEKFDLTLRYGEGEDEIITANRPRMKLLKKVIALNATGEANPDHFATEEGINDLYKLILVIFDNPELTMETLDEVYMEDILTLENINDWINQFFPKKRIAEAAAVVQMRSKQKAQETK